MLTQQARIISWIVFAIDLALISGAFLLAFWVRDLLLPVLMPAQFPTGLLPIREYLKIYPLVLIIWSVLLFKYGRSLGHRSIPLKRESGTAVRLNAVGIAMLATIAYLLPLGQLSRGWFVIFGALAIAFLVTEKVLARAVARWVRSNGSNSRTVLIVGTGRRATDVAHLIAGDKNWGYTILGFISDGHRLSGQWARYRVYGSVPDLKSILECGEIVQPVDEVVFAIARNKLDGLTQIFRMCEELGIRTRVAMNFFGNRVARLEVEELDGVPFLTFTTTPSNETQLAAKRLLDVSLSLLLLTFSLPVLVVKAITIRLSSPGPIVLREERMGLNGRKFTLYKFRSTMDDVHLPRPERPTSVGHWLCRFTLDELPQFWNVLKGDMSLVGPQPSGPEEVATYRRWHRRRLSVKPGLTCLGDHQGRHGVRNSDRRMRLDLQYIDNWSPALDLKILLRTIPAMFSPRM